MAPRGFDRHMLVVGAGRNRKFARLTDSERCAHFLGVLSVCAQSPRRGYLLIAEGVEAGPEEVANEASVTVRVAESAIDKLKRVGVLRRDEEVGAWFVHDWWDVNPAPRTDRTNAERQANYRRRHNGPNNGPDNDGNNATHNAVTSRAVTAPEVEVEAEVPASQVNTNAELRSAVVECFAYWQERCNHQQATLTADRRGKIETRLRERSKLDGGMPRAIRDVRQAIDGAAVAPFIDDRGKRFDDIELICRKGSKLEDFMGRATSRPSLRMIGRDARSQLEDPAVRERIDNRLAEIKRRNEEAS